MSDVQERAILCPNCRKLISADEPVCPHCGTAKPGAKWKSALVALIAPRGDNIVNYIIYVNVAMFVISILFSSSGVGMSGNPLTLFSPSSNAMLLLGATGTVPIDQVGRWWSLLSANYLHGGLLHIVFNMMALRQLGPFVIREYGIYRMMVIYTVSGLIGYWLSYEAGVRFTIGASAAVCGLIGAALYYGKSRGGEYGKAVSKEVSGWIFGLFIFGLIFPGINNWGHGGGILGGIAVGYLLNYRERKADNLVHLVLSAVCIFTTLAVLLWAVGTASFYRLGG